MEIAVRHNPSFAVARMTLAPGEECRAESGAMMAMSGGGEIEAKAEGGFMKSLKRRVLSGEAFFMTTYRARERSVPGGEFFFMTPYRAPGAAGIVARPADLPGAIPVFDASHGIALTK